MMPFATAPTDGTPFLAVQDRELYVAKYDQHGRLMFRTHELRVASVHRIVDAVMDDQLVKAKVPVEEPWTETYEHNWTIWTRGFDFRPTHWCPVPEFAHA